MTLSLADLRSVPHLSVSRITTFPQCPQKHALQYIEHIEPAFRPIAFAFGTAFHEAVGAHLSRTTSHEEVVFDGVHDGQDLPGADMGSRFRTSARVAMSLEMPRMHALGSPCDGVASAEKRLFSSMRPRARSSSSTIAMSMRFLHSRSARRPAVRSDGSFCSRHASRSWRDRSALPVSTR